jgi:hypothetical protein
MQPSALCLGVRPIHPKTYKITDECRLTIGEPFLPSWIDATSGPQSVYCVPLMWARRYQLPDGHQLEAWYIWNGEEESDDWRVAPKTILAGATDSSTRHHQAPLIYEATIELSDRKYRLACTGLLSSLREIGHQRMWVTAEGVSFSIWTDFAFQSWHGSLIG